MSEREPGGKPGAESDRASVQALDALDDAALVALCLSGRREAFDVLVARHRRSVYRLCYRFTGNHEDASDVSQEVLLRAYRGLRTFGGRSSFSTWLYRVGVNVCLNRVGRTALPVVPLDEQDPADPVETAAEGVLRRERAARIRQAIAQLPRKQRATVILRLYHELPHQEIARILGSSVGAVKANLFHALGNLRKLLGEPL